MSEKPFNLNRLFLIAKKDLNFSRQEFFDSTFKEIVDLIKELESTTIENNTNDEYIEKVIPIENISFL